LLKEEGNMIQWDIKEIEIVPKFPWKLSRSTTNKRTNFIIELKDSGFSGLGEVAYNARYGEKRELVLTKFEDFVGNCPEDLNNIEDLTDYLDQFSMPSSLRFGIESAFIHFLSNLSETPVCDLLGVPCITSISTSFSIPVIEAGGGENIEKFIKDHQLERFEALKVKVNSENPQEQIEKVASFYKGKLRIDANEAWKDPDQVLQFMDKVAHIPIEFIEQPMPSDFHDEYLYLKKESSLPLMADESLTSGPVNEYFQERFHGVNVKLMKAGGYLNALSQIRDARHRGLKVMVGCMLETSLGISSALNLCSSVDYVDLDGSLLLKDDPFEYLCEEHGRLFLSALQ
jgi:L-alanine-DL-glutamate epimerase-like enolase superfamily enzyme